MKVRFYCMKIDILFYEKGEIIPKNLGYIELDSFNAHKCYAICNWQHVYPSKPENLHGDVKQASHGWCFVNPETGEEWLSLSMGWLHGTHEEIEEYVKKNKDDIVWV